PDADERAAMKSVVMAVEAVMPAERVPTADMPATDMTTADMPATADMRAAASATADMPATTATLSAPPTTARVRTRAAAKHQHPDQCDQPNQPAHFKHLIVYDEAAGTSDTAARGRV